VTLIPTTRTACRP